MLLALLVGAVSLGGCGAGDDDLTLEEQLSKLAGQPLSIAEVDETLALADTMCGFDTKVLTEIWNRLDARQLEFQDYVFGQHCPDRLSVYETVRLTTGAVPDDVLADADDPSTDDPSTDDPSTDEAEPEQLLPTELLESITSDTPRSTTSTTRRSSTGG